MPVHNAEIATILDRTADLIEIQGGNPFSVRACRRAARVVEALPQSINSLIDSGEGLSKLSGIGKDLAEQSPRLWRADVPVMTTVPGRYHLFCGGPDTVMACERLQASAPNICGP